MNIGKIHKQFLSSKLLLSVIVFVFVAVRLYPAYDQLDDIRLWSCLLIQIGIAFFLLQLNHTFNIFQQHTFLPALFYLLFVGGNPDFYYDLKGSIAALCFVLSYYFLFDSYQKPQSQANALNISLLLVLGSLLWTPLLFLFPVFWIGFYRFQSFNARVFFAGLIGFATVYLFIFAWSIYQGDKDIFLSFLSQFKTLFVVHKPDLTILEWVICGVLLLFGFIIGIYQFFFNISERVWTISVLGYFYLSSFLFFIFLFLQSEYKSTWWLINYVPIAFLAGHFFSRSNKRSVHYLLLLFFLFFVGIGIAQYMGS
ncbi:MAG: hypothetical protein FWF53_04725 [Candidatus Azobacteroides sp.]|nr:hypothetical protein [Candidatus Azobacteroides sp.]